MNDYLHIVCLDAPSPPDYGGAIDMYYKVQALAESGRKIILHYFHYKEHRNADGLEKYCAEIHAYSRSNYLSSLSFTRPYIANSRINTLLINRLNQDDYPVLLEGLHCMGIIPYLQNPSRVVVRMHNEETAYYKALAINEPNFLRKTYYSFESERINRFQNKINPGLKLAVLSNNDVESFKQQGFREAHFIPCFIPWQEIRSITGKGEYCLYHGNMSIIENEIAAIWLIKNVFDLLNIPLVIAGKGISGRLQKIARKKQNIRLIYQPPSNELDALIKDAHINVLPSFNTTGVKLKLLHALLYGRFCIANNKAIKGSGISSSVYTAESAEDFRQTITTLFEKTFAEGQINERQSIRDLYNNKTNALKLSAIW
ncbi:MAG TPA: glycosyltransferase family 4 protein [Flavisolibacter sp.]|nr:glycosyltransferase family 4 protein [Flavisolibacter sp.]